MPLIILCFSFFLFLSFFKGLIFQSSLCPTWGSGSPGRDQEWRAPLTRPARRPMSPMILSRCREGGSPTWGNRDPHCSCLSTRFLWCWSEHPPTVSHLLLRKSPWASKDTCMRQSLDVECLDGPRALGKGGKCHMSLCPATGIGHAGLRPSG